MSRAMRYHYGSEKAGRKGHLAMVKEKAKKRNLEQKDRMKRESKTVRD